MTVQIATVVASIIPVTLVYAVVIIMFITVDSVIQSTYAIGKNLALFS